MFSFLNERFYNRKTTLEKELSKIKRHVRGLVSKLYMALSEDGRVDCRNIDFMSFSIEVSNYSLMGAKKAGIIMDIRDFGSFTPQELQTYLRKVCKDNRIGLYLVVNESNHKLYLYNRGLNNRLIRYGLLSSEIAQEIENDLELIMLDDDKNLAAHKDKLKKLVTKSKGIYLELQRESDKCKECGNLLSVSDEVILLCDAPENVSKLTEIILKDGWYIEDISHLCCVLTDCSNYFESIVV